jgi:hypothetical protein
MEYRKDSGEQVDENSWVMRQIWNTKDGHYHHGRIKESTKLKSSTNIFHRIDQTTTRLSRGSGGSGYSTLDEKKSRGQ